MLCVGELDPDPEQQQALVNRMFSLAREMSEHLSVAGDMPGQTRESISARNA